MSSDRNLAEESHVLVDECNERRHEHALFHHISLSLSLDTVFAICFSSQCKLPNMPSVSHVCVHVLYASYYSTSTLLHLRKIA